MGGVAQKSDPELWERVKAEVTQSEKGGPPGHWSARKAQLAVLAYKKAGGGYRGRKSADNHLEQWSEEQWGTKSGHPSGDTGERYLPKAARDHLTNAEYARTTAKKRRDTRAGKPVSAQPRDIAAKTAHERHNGHADAEKGGPTKAALMQKARERNIPGRSTMSKPQLARALAS